MSVTKVTLDDKTWEFDEEQITLADAFQIKSACGLGLKPFFVGLAEMEPACLQTLIWWLRRRDGDNVAVDSVQFRVMALKIEQQESPTPVATPSGTDATA